MAKSALSLTGLTSVRGESKGMSDIEKRASGNYGQIVAR